MATRQQRGLGWTIELSLLESIKADVNKQSEDGICTEHTEAVILELSKRGYVLMPPNTQAHARREEPRT